MIEFWMNHFGEMLIRYPNGRLDLFYPSGEWKRLKRAEQLTKGTTEVLLFESGYLPVGIL